MIVNENEEVVVVLQRESQTWSLPKGHVEESEDYLTAARREIKEECGLTELVLVKEFPSYERFKMSPNNTEDTNESKRLHFFLFTTNKKDLTPEDADNPEAKWVHKSEVADVLSHEKDKEFFRKILIEI